MTEAMYALQFAVRLFAQDAQTQLDTMGGFFATGDEMALEFERGLDELFSAGLVPIVGSEAERFTTDQIASLRALDDAIVARSGPPEEFWLDPEELRVRPEWEQFRVLAREVIARMGWPTTPLAPPGTYVCSGPHAGA